MNVCASESCCGLAEICELREHENPAEALRVFMEEYTHLDEDTRSSVLGDLPYQVLFDGVQRFVTPVEVVMPNRSDYMSFYDKKFQQHRYDAAVARAQKEVTFGYAGRFAAYLKRNHFGRVFEIPTQPNHNYLNHIIEVYIWHPNHQKLRAWYKAQGK